MAKLWYVAPFTENLLFPAIEPGAGPRARRWKSSCQVREHDTMATPSAVCHVHDDAA